MHQLKYKIKKWYFFQINAKNDIPYVIAFDDIKNQNENEVITNFLEYMITCGYWDYFEYGCDYLKKYDSDFINPYIERYANGDFTENENKLNQEILLKKCLKLNEKREGYVVR